MEASVAARNITRLTRRRRTTCTTASYSPARTVVSERGKLYAPTRIKTRLCLQEALVTPGPQVVEVATQVELAVQAACDTVDELGVLLECAAGRHAAFRGGVSTRR
jgi:hypothetical protein